MVRDDIGANSWTEYRIKVVDTLKDLDADIRLLETKLEGATRGLDAKIDNGYSIIVKQLNDHKDELQKQIFKLEMKTTNDITQLKTKASQWGAIFGAIGGAVVTAITMAIASALLHR